MNEYKKTALLVGATGLVGGHLLRRLLDSAYYDRVIVLTRRPLDVRHPKLQEQIYHFDAPDASVVVADDVFCALGTTLKKAGSKEAQTRVDYAYPLETARLARANGARQFMLVSSVGADAESSNFYLHTKGQLEKDVEALQFDTFVAARPSFLLGNRPEFRLGERIGIIIGSLFFPLMVGPLKKYRGIPADTVAAALIKQANEGKTGRYILHYQELI